MDRELKDKFESAVNDPSGAVSDWKKKTGGKAIGLALVDVPEELVAAAGALPVSVLAREVSFQNVDKHLQQFACSYSRTVIELAETGGMKYLDGLIMPYACDTTRCMDLILKYMEAFPFYDCLRIPRRDHADGADKYYKAELGRLAGRLSEFTGKEITKDSLSAAIVSYNKVRSLLSALRDALREGKSGLTPTEYFSAVRASMVLPVEDVTPLLEQAVASLGKAEGNGSLRVVVAGKLPEPPGVVGLLENAGLAVVEDHLTVGGRWVEASADESGDPWDAMVKRQQSRLPFAGIWSDRPNRASYLIERVKDLKADGAVFLVQKFCEIAELDYPGIKEEMDKQGIPMLSIETDFRESSTEQVRTRVGAFAEMLKANKA